MLSQAKKVLNHYSFGVPRQPDAQGVHFNFMARGEPLSSEIIARSGENLFLKLGEIAYDHGLKPRYLISTIMPESQSESLVSMFPTVHPEIYYSLYSMDPEFRKRWMPRAADPNEALDDLAEWQYHTKKVIKIHFALIEGLNDTPENALAITDAVNARDLRVDYALVRYNPLTEKHGKEAPEWSVQQFAEDLKRHHRYRPRVKVVDRVGPDVAASCGMFVS
ncbi:MAG: radical SAM enzyme, Cfr family protein [Candidatus Altiarchaeales archaeon]|nr:radical SAM enzyme, Cfr family protein [Candidatus Altiarchaeales archaeon]